MHPYIDMHCDSLLRVLEQGEEGLYNGTGMQNIQKMAEAGQMCQFFAIFFRPGWLEDSGSVGKETLRLEGVRTKDERYFEALRNALYAQTTAHADMIAMAHNYAEIQENRGSGRASAVLTIEDGRMVGGCLEKLAELHAKGVRGITLTWNVPNCFGYPHSTDKRMMSRGLTAFGREAVKEMNRLGMLIDVSHLSDGGFFDVVALSDKPFVATHSNCRALAPHTRNLSDDMIVLLAERGGVAGVNLYPPFVGDVVTNRVWGRQIADGNIGEWNGAATDYLEALAAHVMHFINVGGEECVGIGTDFDGMDGELEIDCPAKMELLFETLKRQGMTSGQLDKFLSANVLRVIKDTLK